MKLLTELDSLDNVKDGETRKLITKTTSSGSGNVVSSVSVSGDTITYTKGVTALTAHQNAFSNVKVGSTTVAADSAGDTLELVAGSNITLTPDATNDKVTIAATDTTYESKAAASGGTAVSLVTTGEKYTWNNKSSLKNLLDGNTYYSLRGEATSEESASYSMGYAAFAEGYLTKASGYASHVEGSYAEASADYAHAEGYHTTASGSYSHAEGYYTEAKGLDSHAEGDSTYASNQASHAEGFPFSSVVSGTVATIDQNNLTVTVSGLPTYSYYRYQLYDNSNSFKGNQYISTVSGPSSGIYTFVLSQWDSSLAVGGNFNIALRTTALGYGSHAEGVGTLAWNYWGTHAEGEGTIAISEAQHVEGRWNTPSSTMAHIVGNGTNFTTRSNAYTLDWNGNGVYAGKLTVGAGPTNNMDVATKQYADSVGITSLNIKNGSTTGSLRSINSQAEGDSYTIGQNAVAVGRGTKASGGWSFASGGETTASGNYSSAIGLDTTASQEAAYAEGRQTTASGARAHAEGYGTEATQENAHAEGYYTDANAYHAHTEGCLTVVSGHSGHAEGYHTTASGDYSHAGGNYTTAGYSSQTVIGKYNNNKSTTLFEVGNGTSDAHTNAFEVYSDGRAAVGAGPTNNMDVATKQYVDNSDTKNTAGSTDTSSKIYLIGATSQAANPQTYSDNEVYATSGVLTTKSVQVGGTAATMQYNSTDKCIEFVFA